MRTKKSLKCTVTGDSGVGKTSLLTSYTTKAPAPKDVPVLLDPSEVELTAEDKKHTLTLWDTTYEQGVTRLSPLWYPSTDIFLICFAIDSPDSFERVREAWVPRARHFCPETPCLIVGTKAELRSDHAVVRRLEVGNMQPVQREQGIKMAKELGCSYVECSAREYSNVNGVFDQAVALALQGRKAAKNSRCEIQ